MAATLPVRPPTRPAEYDDAFPHSTKVHIEGTRGIRVPMREITLSRGEPPLRVYDTSGPRSDGAAGGLPKLREEWIAARDVEPIRPSAYPPIRRGRSAVTQLRYARAREITEEMEF
ncbi:MAG TPA: hypothetical protein VHJ69_00510, partial [Gemmatimonadales bacterium]|nr:hypothetical protein [Gemmatimonadales bacterium]